MATPSGKVVASAALPARQAYLVAVACLVLGLVVGYFFLFGPVRSVTPPHVIASPVAAAASVPAMLAKLTLDQMKQMADVPANPRYENKEKVLQLMRQAQNR